MNQILTEAQLSFWAAAGYGATVVIAALFVTGVAGVVIQLTRLAKERRNAAR